MKPPLSRNYVDDFQTPGIAIEPLIKYIPKDKIIWECAQGKKNLVKAFTEQGYKVVGTDILTGFDFLIDKPDFEYDVIVTNPPFSSKQAFLERVYSIGKPFAFLLPLTVLETRKRQKLFNTYGMEMILLPKRINFEVPSGKESCSWFATCWITNWLNIGKQIVYPE